MGRAARVVTFALTVAVQPGRSAMAAVNGSSKQRAQVMVILHLTCGSKPVARNERLRVMQERNTQATRDRSRSRWEHSTNAARNAENGVRTERRKSDKTRRKCKVQRRFSGNSA